jgi:hypothetical protein
MGVVYMKATNIHPLVICARLPFTTTRYPTRHCSKISGAPAVSLPPYARFARNEVQLAKNYPCEEHFMSRTSPILKGPEHRDGRVKPFFESSRVRVISKYFRVESSRVIGVSESSQVESNIFFHYFIFSLFR